MRKIIDWYRRATPGQQIMAVLMLSLPLKAFYVYGSQKPPAPPAPEYRVTVQAAALFDSLMVSPTIPETMRDALYGQRCDVQLQTDSGGWMTIKTVPAYDLTPIYASGIYVSGGRGRVRRVRLSWPDAQYETEAEELPQ